MGKISTNLVSIITPVFNREADLPLTIRSVLNQTHSNWELLLVDDGSTDNSLNIVRLFSSQDHRIHSIRRDDSLPKGASACRNIGIDRAKGDFIMFLDSDDLLAQSCLEHRVQTIIDKPYDFIVTQTGIIRKSNPQIKKIWSSLLHKDDVEAFVKMEGWCVSSTFFRSDFVKKYKFDPYAPSLQDWSFHLSVLLDRPNYRKYPDSNPDVFVRSGHGGRISVTNNSPDRLVKRLEVFLRMEQQLIAKGYLEYANRLDRQYLKHLNHAAIFFEGKDYTELKNVWRKSCSYIMPIARSINFYLTLQRCVRFLKLRVFHGVVYRVARAVFPKHLFLPNRREVLLQNPIPLEKGVEQLIPQTQKVTKK
ncbi:glycosyltransferase family 2 protein [uncultured Roseivirga sp.]|uniref:glycosyltransferase family 2 protein n=1 Tax=uncultured Roseivirga sp. TaxID=543088 RepID=UPI0025853B66|nr:glycosyltransferase family 2 protein [uncultured Roseivirga sp.]MEC7754761.1 glycosyltransferase family 2 protein [Bacteroidota bacterium]|tara:strand:- start:5237 stop:6325 length:1089 start_codon:yes stop_codon:yes gene_type:complete